MTTRGRPLVGMSGWVYPDWRGPFYPKGTTQKNELAYASRHVTSIELNASFYSLQKPASWQKWRDATPDEFLFAVKGPRFITHIRRLDDVHEPLANFFASGILALGSKLSAVLWQLPPSLEFEPYLIERFLEQLPHTTTAAVELASQRGERMKDKEWLTTDAERPLRHAIEVRHPTFENEEFLALLGQYRVAPVLIEPGGKRPSIDLETTDFRYLRMHGDLAIHEGGFYTERDLDELAARVNAWLDRGLDTYMYFNNDAKAHAPIDAMNLLKRLNA